VATVFVLLAANIGGSSLEAREVEYRYVRIEKTSIGYSSFFFSATIFADGVVFYEATNPALEIGLRHFEVGTEVFSQVSQLIDDSTLRATGKEIRDGANGCINHSSFLTIEDRSKERSERGRDGWRPTKVKRFLGCEFEGKAEFQALFQILFEKIQLAPLVGTSDEQSQQSICDIFTRGNHKCRDELRERQRKAAPREQRQQ
jgi:hypothetical protein